MGEGGGAAFTEMPIAWEHTGDGELPYRATVNGVELLVRVNDFPAEPLYSLLAGGLVQEHLDDWPFQWIRPAVTPAHLLRAAGAAQVRRGRLDAIVAAAWASELSVLPRCLAPGAVSALGLKGTLDGRPGHWLLSPPPPGTTRFSVSEHDDDVFTVEVTLSGPGPSRADLSALLGPGRDGVRIHYDQPYPVWYQAAIAGAPYTCDVFAYFAAQPTATTTADRIMFRRQKS